MNIIEERTIALAGVLQAAQQVQQLARTGSADESAMHASLQSILVLDALNTPAVFGGLEGVRNGLILLAGGILASPAGEDIEILRYTMTLLNLHQQLHREQAELQRFGAEVERLSAADDAEFSQACADIYQKHISKLQPQVIVQGEESYLQQPSIPRQIRSLLLAGIRAAVLWQQKGGGRFKLVWERTRMRNAATALLQQLPSH